MEADSEAQRRKLEKFTDELSQEFFALRATYNEVSGIYYINYVKLFIGTLPLKKETLPIPTSLYYMVCINKSMI